MHTRPLTSQDTPEYQSLLMLAPEYNPFHLSALAEYGLEDPASPQGMPWATGAFRERELVGTVMALRGTGGIYHCPGDTETLHALAEVAFEKASQGTLSLLSGHASQIAPLLPLIAEVGVGQPDRCIFRTLYPQELVQIAPVSGFAQPRIAIDEDMERLVDFYQTGFYSLAHLPTRAAWQNRLTDQLAFRTLFLIEDEKGNVISAALSSAEGSGSAMLGGVATLAEYRSKGLSALCVGALCDHLFKKGMDSISLFYLMDNAPAGRVYDKLGFRDAGEWLLVPLGLAVPFGPLFGIRSREPGTNHVTP